MSDDETSLGARNYTPFAARYAEAAETNAYNGHYERPATLSLLPDVAGLRVLDAACGPGFYSEWLARRGAQVVGCDVTPEMVEIARARNPGVEVRRHDLERPIDWLGDGAVDLVLFPLALDYFADTGGLFREFHRVTTPGGWLVFSAGHPMTEWMIFGGNYYDTSLHAMEWKGFGEPKPVIDSYRRSLQDTLNPVIEAGYVIERLLEPRPSEEVRRVNPESYRKLAEKPAFLCVRARKPG
jgi:SAM-dependent methyltransferase